MSIRPWRKCKTSNPFSARFNLLAIRSTSLRQKHTTDTQANHNMPMPMFSGMSALIDDDQTVETAFEITVALKQPDGTTASTPEGEGTARQPAHLSEIASRVQGKAPGIFLGRCLPPVIWLRVREASRKMAWANYAGGRLPQVAIYARRERVELCVSRSRCLFRSSEGGEGRGPPAKTRWNQTATRLCRSGRWGGHGRAVPL